MKNKHFNDIFIKFLCFCCVLFVITPLILICKSCNKHDVKEISITVVTDKDGHIDKESEEMAVMKLVSILRQQDEFIKDRYNILVGQIENERNLINYSGFVLSIIIALLSFFGYKSFRSIEEKAISIVHEKLSESENEILLKIKDKIDLNQDNIEQKINIQNNINNKNINRIINQKINAIVSETINPQINKFNQINSVLDDYAMQIAVLDKKIKDLIDSGINPPEKKELIPKDDLTEIEKDRENKKQE